MKILITGAAGFIGSHLAQALCERGAKVIALDNLSLGTLKNLEWRKPSHDLELVEGDICDEDLLKKIVPGCEWIFHEAALPSVPRSVKQPIESNNQNLVATLNLLTVARDSGVRRLLFASSSSVYGNSDSPRKHEELPVGPLSPYALQKYAAERYCQLFFSLYGLETVALRYFNVFGPRQAFNSPYSGVIAKFCTSMLRGERPIIFGDGLQSRDFTFIENVVAANLKAAEAPAEKVAGQVFNAAAGDNITLLRLVDDLNGLTGQSLEPVFESPRVGDIRSSCASIEKAQKAFGYTVKTEWAEGLRRTLKFYREESATA